MDRGKRKKKEDRDSVFLPHLLSADGLKKINSDLLQILIKQICELDAPGKKEKEFESLIPQNRFNSNSDVGVIQRVTFKCLKEEKGAFSSRSH